MDPLSISASIAGLLALSGTVIQYLSAIEGASETHRRLSVEACSACGLLYSLKDLCEQTEMPSGCFTSLEALCIPRGPFDQYKKALELLADKLAPVKGREKIKKQLTWFFERGEAKALIDMMERQKTYFILALQGNHMALSQELSRSIAGIDTELQKIQLGIENLSVEQSRQSLEQLQKHELDLLSWLSSTGFADRKRAVLHQIQPGTGQWLLHHDTFTRWLTGRDPEYKLLWLPGIPGAGKTSLAALAIDHLERQYGQSDVGIAYVFCDYQDPNQTCEALSRSVARQLLHQLHGWPKEVDDMYRIHRRKSTNPNLGELVDVLLLITRRFTRIFLVIDALDEASGLNGVIEHLLTLCKDLSPNIQSLVTSRWTGELTQEIRQAKQIEVSAQDQDIAAYLHEAIKTTSRLRLFVHKEPSFENEIVSTIIQNCRGMFLVARLHIESLAGKVNLRAAKLALKQLPTTLDALYESAMDRIRKQPEEEASLALRILAWIVHSITPLTSDQIQHALAVEPDSATFDHDALIDMDLILSVCAGIVVLNSQNSNMRLVHYTAQEFFERRGMQMWPRAQHDIAQVCLKYLSLQEVFGSSSRDDGLIEKLAAFPLLEYAVKNWGTHVSRCNCDKGNLDDLVEAFLNDDSAVAGAAQIMILPKWKYRGSRRNVTTNAHALHLAAHFNLLETAERLLKSQHPSVRDRQGGTPLHWAAQTGHPEIIKLLLRHDANVDALNSSRETPLALACEAGHLDVVSVLIEHGCHVNMRDRLRRTALYRAAGRGYEKIAALLLENSADIDDRGVVLRQAVARGQDDVVCLLLQHGADPNAPKINLGYSLLLRAVRNSDEVIMRRLLEAGALVDYQTGSGVAALHGAASLETAGPVRLLLEFGANPNSKDRYGRTPLHCAAYNCSLAAVTSLLPITRLPAVDNDGETVLHAAISLQTKDSDTGVVRFLLESGKFDINAKDKRGWSAVTHSVYEGLPKLTGLLLDAGANPALQEPGIQAMMESIPSLERRTWKRPRKRSGT